MELLFTLPDIPEDLQLDIISRLDLIQCRPLLLASKTFQKLVQASWSTVQLTCDTELKFSALHYLVSHCSQNLRHLKLDVKGDLIIPNPSTHWTLFLIEINSVNNIVDGKCCICSRLQKVCSDYCCVGTTIMKVHWSDWPAPAQTSLSIKAMACIPLQQSFIGMFDCVFSYAWPTVIFVACLASAVWRPGIAKICIAFPLSYRLVSVIHGL